MSTRRILLVASSVSGLALFFGLGAPEFLGFEIPRVLAVGPSSCISQPSFPGSARGWWPGDRHSRDIIGTSPLTLTGGAAFAGGKVSDGFFFDGVNDYGDAGATPDLAVTNLTVAAWVRTTASGPQTIVERGAGGDPARRNFYLGLTSSGRVRFAVGDGTTEREVLGTSSVNDDAFHLVAGVMAAGFGGRMQVFVDGTLETEALFAGIAPFTTPPQVMTVGASDASSLSGVQVSEPFGGVIDELVFWGFPFVGIADFFEAGEAGICKGLPGQRTGFTIGFDLGVAAPSYTEAEIRVSRPDMNPLDFQTFGGSLELVNPGGIVEFDHGGNPFTVIRIASARSSSMGAASFTSAPGAMIGVNLGSLSSPVPVAGMAIPDPVPGWLNIASFQWQVPGGASMAIDELVIQLPDVDGDRIEDAIDTDPLGFSDDFSDVAADAGGTTTGRIESRGQQILSITEQPGSGVRIRTDPSGGSMPTRIRVCGGRGVYTLRAGDNQVISACSSVTTAVARGTVEVELIAEDGTVATTTLSEPNALTFDPASFTFTAPASNTGPIVVLIAGVPFEVVAGDSVQIARIDIKPGSSTNPINTKSKGKIPVAILSLTGFDAPAEVDTGSLTFGRTGVEPSLALCSSGGQDVNGDRLPDLMCHFYTQEAGFQPGDGLGFLVGQTQIGVPIRGSDTVRVVNR